MEGLARSADTRRKLLKNFQRFELTWSIEVHEKSMRRGGFGDIHRGTYKKDRSMARLAVKKVHQGLTKESYQKHFEVRVCRRLVVAHFSHVRTSPGLRKGNADMVGTEASEYPAFRGLYPRNQRWSSLYVACLGMDGERYCPGIREETGRKSRHSSPGMCHPCRRRTC